MAQVRQAVLILILVCPVLTSAGNGAKFFPDDPIERMPAPMPVTAPLQRGINQIYDFLVRSKEPNPRPPTPAAAINTLGEVPDSDWFTNRHGRRRMTHDELKRGPGPDIKPTPPFTIVSGKPDGISMGFVMVDSQGRGYFAKIDPAGNPELTTAAEAIVSRFMYAIGYNTPKNDVLHVKFSDLHVSRTATMNVSNGKTRPMTWGDVEDMTTGIPLYPDGSFRVVASLEIEGEHLGPFRYEGTRKDDPNDIVPHEQRRDLRGLYVFSSWLNNTDMRANNTLDTLVKENEVPFIRHYLLDFGSALGSNGDRPKDARMGYRFMLPTPAEALQRIFSLGLVPADWERVPYADLPAVGNFESSAFEPDEWKSNYPNVAFLSRLPDDDFWAAKQVMAFTDADIRAIVETGRYTDPRSSGHVIETLAERRDKIGRVFFSKVLPLDHFRVEGDYLRFDDLAVVYGFRPPQSYDVQWFRFDNDSGQHDSIRDATTAELPPLARRARPGAYFAAAIQAMGSPAQSVSVYIRKERAGYKVVGIERKW
jgi:hypothetical protein